MDENRVKRDLVHLFHCGEDHARDPEEDDVIARDHDGSRIPVAELSRLFRPAHRGEGPERRGEPGIQDVLVAADMLAVAVGALGRILAGNGDLAAVVTVPGRDLMAPPKLAGDAPVVHVFHPVEIGLRETIRHELDPPVLHDLDRLLGKRLHFNEPLRARQRFDDRAAAIAAANVVAVRLDLDEIALLLEIGDDRLAAFVTIHAVVFAAVDDLRILIDTLDLLEIMAQTDFIVVRVVAGRHLDSAGAKAKLDIIIRHDRQLSPDKRENGVFTDKMRIALVRGVDRNTGVAQHRLGTCGGDDEFFVGILDRIADVPKAAGDVLVFHLGVRKRRAAVRAPVDDAASLVDQALVIQLAESLTDGLGAGLVHRETAAIPIAGDAHAFLLLDDAIAVLSFPVPDALEELVAPEIIAGLSLFLAQHFLDLDLRGDARVIDAGQPQGGIALHALIARQDVLQRRVKRMTHVELPRDIGRRHDDGERLFIGVDLALEIATFHPKIIYFFLDRFRVIGFRQFFHFLFSSPFYLMQVSSFATDRRILPLSRAVCSTLSPPFQIKTP